MEIDPIASQIAYVCAEIFRQYQEQADEGELLLGRYPPTLMNGLLLFARFWNCARDHSNYVAVRGTFLMASSSLCGSLALIKEISRLALQNDIPFNEILSAAYIEKQKMFSCIYGEYGLGPVAASFSLGSAAFMHFRAHAISKEVNHSSSSVLTLILQHGDVLIMKDDGIQQHTVTPMNFRIAATGARRIGTA
ncbi:hypothetical protein BDR07DRAFT_1358721 [Suillus spraguei]|nr:hypothetical protein BDR07DRAFT_1358721 [Suillus spraguei]